MTTASNELTVPAAVRIPKTENETTVGAIQTRHLAF